MVDSKATGIELDEDRPFQERFWSFQRIAWVVMGLIVAAALAGLTGAGGLLSRAEATAPGATLDYPRVTRWQASDDMRLTLAPRGADQATIMIGASFFDIFEIEEIHPAPAESGATASGQRLVFDLGEASGEREIIFHIRATAPALTATYQVRVDDGPAMRLSPVVLP